MKLPGRQFAVRRVVTSGQVRALDCDSVGDSGGDGAADCDWAERGHEAMTSGDRMAKSRPFASTHHHCLAQTADTP